MKEDEILRFWKEHRIYEALKKRRGKKYYFLDGPPYATGFIHTGTALNKILKDAYIRFFRMTGFDVWDQPGYDTHGLPIENKVEKKLGIKSKTDIEKLGIKKFVEECRMFATQFIEIMNSQFADLGIWMDWETPYLTLTNDYIQGAWHTFKVAYEKGLLYNGLYPVHVCPHCETAVAYNEIEYRKDTDPSIYVKFHVSKNEYLVIWTTTPWTLPSNTGVMAKPDADYVKIRVGEEILIMAKDLMEDVMKKAGITDYKIIKTVKGADLKGLKYEHPLANIFRFQNDISHYVVLSDQYVTMDTGTGLVHTAPGHGHEDYKVGIENKLAVISPVKLNGTYDDTTGSFAGKFVKACDHEILHALEDKGLLLHKDKITHDYPHCWRCDSPLILISVPQWFFRVTSIRDALIEENKKINWTPKWAGQRFDNWLRNLGDWPISRQRYWGIPLPIWTCKCGKIRAVGPAKELPVTLDDLHRPFIDQVKLKCECGSEMHRIPDVLDVWFDSGLASWASIGYPENSELFQEMWPSDLQIEGPDQIRGWWNSEMITSYITFGKAPFRNVIFHGFALDAHGAKMSKSKGNVINPEDAVKRYGRDALRFYFLSNPAWDDFYFSWTGMEQISKSFAIINNAFNYVKTYVSRPGKANYRIEDEWMLSRLSTLIESCTRNMETFNVHKAAKDIEHFLINDFSRWYIKIVRDRVKSGDEGAYNALYVVSRESAKLLAPICPFIAERVQQHVRLLDEAELSVHLEKWPSPAKSDRELEKSMEVAKEIYEACNSLRKRDNVKLRWPLRKLVISDQKAIDSRLLELLKSMCNVKEISFGSANLPSKDISACTIYLDTMPDESLKEEALLRELVREIQSVRKQEHLVVSDRIHLRISSVKMKKFEQFIKDYVGADVVEFGEVDDQKCSVELEGEKIAFSFRRI